MFGLSKIYILIIYINYINISNNVLATLSLFPTTVPSLLPMFFLGAVEDGLVVGWLSKVEVNMKKASD